MSRDKSLGSPVQWLLAVPICVICAALAATMCANLPAWLEMWSLAFCIYVGLKWLTWIRFVKSGGDTPAWHAIAYLMLWPGMNPREFLAGGAFAKHRAWIEWLGGFCNTFFGASLLWIFSRLAKNEIAAGWIGMAGMIFLLHFGTFRLIALFWQRFGFGAKPLMSFPLAAHSLSEFWGRRWNRAFHDLTKDLLYQPLRRRIDPVSALLIAFAASGLVHDLVISLPAKGGYGLPTFYFFAQGLGIVFERSRTGKQLGVDKGWHGRLFALAVTAGPAFWLFHPAFVSRVIVPFLRVIGAWP